MQDKNIDKLCQDYMKYRKIGFFLGAGVSIGSNIPNYLDLVFQLVVAVNDMIVNDSKIIEDENQKKALTYLAELFVKAKKEQIVTSELEFGDIKKKKGVRKKNQNTLLEEFDPEEVALFVSNVYNSVSKHKTINDLLESQISDKLDENKRKMLMALSKNDTLNSIITFCIEYPLTDKHQVNERTASGRKTNIYTGKQLIELGKYLKNIKMNPKLGCILTTNYDPILESSCHKKYYRQKGLLKPVVRAGTRENFKRGTSVPIPVYHLHGYYPLKKWEVDQPSIDLIITEQDYFKSAYDSMSYCNYVAMSSLRKYPFIFIGSAMKDKNIRRFLYHLRVESKEERQLIHYAIMEKPNDPGKQAFHESILRNSYNVVPIWIECFNEIPEILKKVYASGNKRKEEEWDLLYNYKYISNS